ncbi:MAG: glycine cleavage system aminomethyltransferase GcvT [Candidatus Omnitrophota bacterium]|nr:glycine cleavage system aminomethyltransferase GcvT [Candidatus Omnitrophota bacterium]MDZ4242376.1 glycine cleavage system aminomethyltransferase GcvT [Candidatus Omnitrophota bacterium]
MMSSDTDLKQTPLYDEHLRLKAKMVPFGGWEMPLQYEGILAEYEDTRKRVTVFDTSHMGEFLISGDALESGLDRVVTQPLADMPLKTCRYGVMLNDRAGVIDDLIVYRISADRWMVVVNGATMEKDARQFQNIVKVPGAFSNVSFETGKLDIQGPQARDLLSPLVRGIGRLDYYAFDTFEVMGEDVIVSRTGYTGELGYEIYFPWGRTPELWREILRLGAQPAGLGVRDVLRIEMGYCLYGHELDEAISPLDAGLNKFIAWDKDFFGKESLLLQKNSGVSRRLACFASESRRSPRVGHRLYAASGEEIGTVTSGTFSPFLNKGVGLGFVGAGHGTPGEKILFGGEGQALPGEIVKRPVYPQGSLKS